MHLTPREKDKLLVSMAAMVARRRLERGVKLNHPEAVALITDFIVEGARDGRTVAELMDTGAQVLSREQLLNGVWGYAFDPGTNVVEVYVGYLRRKLARDGTPAPIETLRSVGYKLVDRA